METEKKLMSNLKARTIGLRKISSSIFTKKNYSIRKIAKIYTQIYISNLNEW